MKTAFRRERQQQCCWQFKLRYSRSSLTLQMFFPLWGAIAVR